MAVGLMAVIVDYLGGTVSGIPLQWEAHRAVQRAVTMLRGKHVRNKKPVDCNRWENI